MTDEGQEKRRERNADFARNLRKAREDTGLTQRSFAKEVDIDFSQISSYELGDYRPSGENKTRLLTYFGVSDFDVPASEFDAARGHLKVNPYVTELRIFTPEFDGEISSLTAQAKQFIHYSSLCRTRTREPNRPFELWDESFVGRLVSREIAFQRVEVFFEKDRLIHAMKDACQFADKDYSCRYFLAPPASIPIINIRSYDDKRFILGGFHEERAPNVSEPAIVFDDRQPIARFLQEYWLRLWEQSQPFSPKDSWASLEPIAESLDIKDREWRQIKKDVQSETVQNKSERSA